MDFSGQIVKDVKTLLNYFEYSQWTFKPNFDLVANLPIVTRDDLRNTKMVKGLYTKKTSGSTGEPVTIEKYYSDYVWYIATNIREFRWRKWDVTKTIANIQSSNKRSILSSWGIPKEIEPFQGKQYLNGFEPISVLQKWLEETNPHYIQATPTIIKQLDLSKISNYIDHKGSGELGGSMYSSEECGTIAIQCPDNTNMMHVMENIIVEVETDGSVLITTTTNPYIKRYKHGDNIELGECTCGRTLQTIKKINGRIRNMFVMPNGDKKWLMIGSRSFYEDFGIKQYKAIQTSLNTLELYIICDPLGEREKELKELVLKWLNSPIEIIIKYVDYFPNYKFEEFISLV